MTRKLRNRRRVRTLKDLLKQLKRADPNLKTEENPKSKLESLLQERIERSDVLKALQEDLSRDNNTGLSTGAVATFIMSGFRPMLVAESVMKVIVQDIDTMDDLTVPISTKLSAGEVADDGSLAIQTSKDYTSRAVDFSMYGVYNAATFELLRHSNPDLMGYEFEKMGYALSEIADTLMVAAFDVAAPEGGAESNYVGLGDNKWADLDDVFSAMETMMGARLRPRIVLTNPNTWRRLVYSSPVAMPVSNLVDLDRPYSVNIGGFRFIASHNIAAKNIYVIDPDECGYLFRHPITSFSYRESGMLVEDFWAYMRMGVAIGQRKSIFRIQEDADEYPASV